MNRCRSFLTLTIVALGACAFAQTDDPAPVQGDSEVRVTEVRVLAPLADVIGIAVVNDDQIYLGEIDEVLVETRSGEIRYAVIDIGSFLGLSRDPRVVPWHQIRVDADLEIADVFHASTELTDDQVKSAPVLKSGPIMTADLDRRVESALGSTGVGEYGESPSEPLMRMTELRGVVVTDSTGARVGNVVDVVVAPQDRYVTYAILDTSSDAEENHISILWQSLNVSVDDRQALAVSTPVERTRFARAPRFVRSDWQRMSSTVYVTEVGNYYGTTPYWTTIRTVSTYRLPTPAETTDLTLVSDDDLYVTVRNQSQDTVGVISDLLVDPRSGEIRYAVLDTGGFLSMGESGKVIPWNRITIVAETGTSDSYSGTTSLTNEQIKSAPVLQDGVIFAKDIDRRIMTAFGQDGARSLSNTGEMYLVRLGEMTGVSITGPSDEYVGNIQKIVLSPSQSYVAYAVVDTRDDSGSRIVALPWSSMRYNIASNSIGASTTVAHSRIASGPRYDYANWERMSSRGWVSEINTYYGVEPYWTSSTDATVRIVEHQKTIVDHQKTAAHYITMCEEIFGVEVKDNDNAKLGQIRDLLIAPDSGEICYAVLGVGGILGIGEEARIIPWRFIHIAGADGNSKKCTATSSLTAAQVKLAPLSSGNEVIRMDIANRFDAIYGRDPKAPPMDSSNPAFARLTQMNGTELHDPTGQEVGEIRKVILAPQNHALSYVIVEPTEQGGDLAIALPLSCMTLDPLSNGELNATTSVSFSRFANAPKIDDDNWQRMSSTSFMDELSSYYGCPAYWTVARFSMARLAPAERP